jgi:hypothetical protein
MEQLITDIKNKHIAVQQTIAHGVKELMQKKGEHNVDYTFDFQKFLDRFYMSRISIR